MDIRALEQWYRMNKARNFSEFYKAVSMTSLPMFNIMYADRYDTIFLYQQWKDACEKPGITVSMEKYSSGIYILR